MLNLGVVDNLPAEVAKLFVRIRETGPQIVQRF